jgi:VWFA-related protein
MSRSRRFVSALLLSFSCLPWSQQSALPIGPEKRPATNTKPASSLVPPGKTLGLEGLIHLDVTVMNQAGQTIGLLKRDNFTVFDNGQPQKIVAFRDSIGDESTPETSSVILFLDTLDVPPELATFEQQQAIKYLRRNDGFLVRPVTIYSLDSRGLGRTPEPTTDGNLLADELQSDWRIQIPLEPANTPSDVFTKKYGRYPPLMALRAIGVIATEEHRHPGRKLLLWIGSGLNDRGSGAYLDRSYYDSPVTGPPGSNSTDLTRAMYEQEIFNTISWFSTLLRESRISIDCFSVGEREWALTRPSGEAEKDAWKPFLTGVTTPKQANVMNLYKKVLAVQSGGRIVPPDEDLAKHMDECVQQLAAFYSLTFEPPVAAAANEYHSLRIQLSRPELTTFTNSGYYDQPYYDDQPDPATHRVTVAELQTIMDATPKRETTHMLPPLSLTERLSNAQRLTLRKQLHRGEARDLFDALADQSAFLAPPLSEILSDPPPDNAEQQRIIAAADRFLSENIARLPNFFADRHAVTIAETAGLHLLDTTINSVPFHVEENFGAVVSYRKGAEIVGDDPALSSPNGHPLFTYGTFGPLLRTTLKAAIDLRGSMAWSRWERVADGRNAVFHFVVPQDKAGDLRVSGCCLPQGSANSYAILPAYHGEVTIDPASGAIRRVEVQADLAGFVPVKRSDLIVTYGPVEIGGKTYILPVRSVSLSRGRSVVWLHQGAMAFKTWGPYQTRINEFSFDHYRMFHGEARMLPGFKQMPQDQSPAEKSTPQ